MRLSFVCKGETPLEQVECCLHLLEGFRSCSLEKDSLQLLRQKNGFAPNAKSMGGYRDVKIFVYADVGEYTAFDGTKIPLRIIGEVQLILDDYKQVKDRMHLAYEINRGSFDHPAPRMQSPCVEQKSSASGRATLLAIDARNHDSGHLSSLTH